MEVDEYLQLHGRLYRQAVQSQEPPELLADFGGVFALAAQDAQQLRVEKNGTLGFIDRQRTWGEVGRAAGQLWSVHAGRIRDIATKGRSIEEATAEYLLVKAKTKNLPINAVENLTTEIQGPLRTLPRWQYDVLSDRAEFLRGLDVMTDTLPAIVAGTEYVITGDWRDAIAAGEFARPFINLLDAALQTRQARGYVPPQTRSIKPEAAEIRDKEGRIRSVPSPPQTPLMERDSSDRGISNKGVLTGKPHVVQRGTQSLSPLPSQVKPKVLGPTSVAQPGIRTEQRERTDMGLRSSPADLANAYLASKARNRQKLIPSDDTRAALTNIYARAQGYTLDGRPLKKPQPRAAAGELIAIEQKLADPNVDRVELIPRGTERSPDGHVVYRAGTNLRPEGYEITTATQAASGEPLRTPRTLEQKAAQVPITVPTIRPLKEGTAAYAIRRKAKDTPRRPSQLRDGGTLAVVALFPVPDIAEWASKEMAIATADSPSWPHIRRIEFYAPTKRDRPEQALRRTRVAYEQQDNGSFQRVPW